jgi:hypothetical protein
MTPYLSGDLKVRRREVEIEEEGREKVARAASATIGRLSCRKLSRDKAMQGAAARDLPRHMNW